MDRFSLAGKRAVVTGGTRGLGRAIAEGLMEAGAQTVIVGTSDQVFVQAKSFCAQGFSCQGVRADLASDTQRRTAFSEAVSSLGGLDILVNAAGILTRSSVEELSYEDWEAVLQLDLNAVFVLSQLAVQEFLRKEKPCGKIINIASMHSFGGGLYVSSYAAAKGGVAQLSKAMSNELMGRGISVNCIAPGFMATDMNREHMKPGNARGAEILSRIPAHRWGSMEDIKGLAIFLASPASDYISGAVIPCDGGYLVY